MVIEQPKDTSGEKDTILRFRTLNKVDFYILIVLCLVTMSIALYDFYKQKEIEQRCLTDCNNHWVYEFENKCMGIYGSSNFTDNFKGLIYTYNNT